MNKLYSLLMYMGKLSGCHQLQERSFFFRGYKFPVCARCTGVFLGYICGLCVYPIIKINIFIALSFCGVMFTDWFLQYKEILCSNNKRRLVTGFLCGMGYIHFLLNFINVLINIVF